VELQLDRASTAAPTHARLRLLTAPAAERTRRSRPRPDEPPYQRRHTIEQQREVYDELAAGWLQNRLRAALTSRMDAEKVDCAKKSDLRRTIARASTSIWQIKKCILRLNKLAYYTTFFGDL
jgi:hypothetical protein